MSWTIEEIDHTADWGVDIHADSREELVLASFEALELLLGINKVARTLEQSRIVRIESESEEPVDALIDVLNQWLFEIQENQVQPGLYQVDWAKTLSVTMHIPDKTLASLQTEVKAVTYHEAVVEEQMASSRRWHARWIADL